jgi:hypothetical protein
MAAAAFRSLDQHVAVLYGRSSRAEERLMPWIRPERFPQVPVAVDRSPLLAPDFAPFAGHLGWRAGWTHVVSGSFSASPFSGLLC